MREAIKRIRIGKAAGRDEIAPEFIKYGGPRMAEILLNILREVWRTKTIPEE